MELISPSYYKYYPACVLEAGIESYLSYAGTNGVAVASNGGLVDVPDNLYLTDYAFGDFRVEEYRTNLAPHYGCWSAISSSVKNSAGTAVFASANSVGSLVDPDEGQIKGEVWGYGPVAATFMATAGFDELRSGEAYAGPTDPMVFTEPKYVVILGWTVDAQGDTEWIIMYNKEGWGTDGIGRVRLGGFVGLTLWRAKAEWRGK